MSKEQELQVLEFQIQRVFASLGRNVLVLLEDLKIQHANNFDKLKKNLPTEFSGAVDLSDYFDANFYNYFRKKVLDTVNNGKRDLESAIYHQ